VMITGMARDPDLAGVGDRLEPDSRSQARLIGIGRRSPAVPCHTTVRTGPYTAVRVGYADTSSINDGSPSDLR
jgi:hypothetical protein